MRFCRWPFPNPLQCCLPDPSPHSDYLQLPDNLINTIAAQPLQPPPPPLLPIKTRAESKPDIDVGIQELIASVNALVDGDADRSFTKLRLLEKKKAPPPTLPPYVDPKSRADCIDRLVDAADKLHCSPSTLHLAVNYFDRYLSQNDDDEVEDLLLLGIACLMIAAKYDGVQDQFHFDAYVRLCRNIRAGRDDLIRTEACVLSFFDYDMAAATAWGFLTRFVGSARRRHGEEAELECMVSYYAEVSLLSASMLRFSPSMVAAAAVFLARYVLEPSEKPWSGALRYCTMYEACDLRDCVVALHDCCYGRSSYYLPAVSIKYSKKKNAYVALKIAPRSIPLHIFED